MYRSSWSLLNGLELDIPCEITDIILANMSNGMYSDGYMVYYIESSRESAIAYLRSYIAEFMTRCIKEHDEMLDSARADWKKCK